MSKKNKKQKKKTEEKIKPKIEMSHSQWYFLAGVVIFSIIILLIKPETLAPSSKFFISILLKIIPVIIIVFVLLIIVDLFVTPRTLIKYVSKESKSKIKWFGWPVAITAGIISTGPIYMWYPLLSDLQGKGVRNGFIAAFLYNRAIKPALIPLIIFYFGLAFTLILTGVMIITSIFQGLIVEKILKIKK